MKCKYRIVRSEVLFSTGKTEFRYDPQYRLACWPFWTSINALEISEAVARMIIDAHQRRRAYKKRIIYIE